MVSPTFPVAALFVAEPAEAAEEASKSGKCSRAKTWRTSGWRKCWRTGTVRGTSAGEATAAGASLKTTTGKFGSQSDVATS
jgi:hypothetical protein